MTSDIDSEAVEARLVQIANRRSYWSQEVAHAQKQLRLLAAEERILLESQALTATLDGDDA